MFTPYLPVATTRVISLTLAYNWCAVRESNPDLNVGNVQSTVDSSYVLDDSKAGMGTVMNLHMFANWHAGELIYRWLALPQSLLPADVSSDPSPCVLYCHRYWAKY